MSKIRVRSVNVPIWDYLEDDQLKAITDIVEESKADNMELKITRDKFSVNFCLDKL